MAKWVLLFFVVALAWSGWFASQDDAPGWAPVLPTLVLAVAVITGLIHAIRWGMRRQKEMAALAAQLGFNYELKKPELLDSGIGVLKQFAHCRHKDDLPFLSRGMRTDFAQVMTTHTDGAEVFLFDYSTSRGKGVHYHGFFACFKKAGADLPDLEIVPRLWGSKPEWARYFSELPPARAEMAVQHSSFAAEYLAHSADATTANEDRARERLTDDLLDRLAEPQQTGWRIEMSGDWLAVTRLGPAKKIGGLVDPMEPEKVSREDRYSYHVDYIAPRHVERFYEEARNLHRLLTRQ